MVFILVLIISAILQIFLPWYIIVPTTFLICTWQSNSAWRAFYQSFVAIAVLWGSYSLYIHLQSDAIMTSRIAGIFTLPFPELVLVLTILIGGIAAGFGGLTGYYFKVAFLVRDGKRGFNRKD